MREILFRGKRLDNGEWVSGTMYRIARDLNPFIMEEDKHGCSYPLDEETVGQYTGLNDKNGKRIFEGDIVEGVDYTSEDGGYGVVGFDDGAFEVSGNDCYGTFHENYWGKDFEVIGNIHDNPELLKGGEG